MLPSSWVGVSCDGCFSASGERRARISRSEGLDGMVRGERREPAVVVWDSTPPIACCSVVAQSRLHIRQVPLPNLSAGHMVALRLMLSSVVHKSSAAPMSNQPHDGCSLPFPPIPSPPFPSHPFPALPSFLPSRKFPCFSFPFGI
jgi:hypothetical protein